MTYLVVNFTQPPSALIEAEFTLVSFSVSLFDAAILPFGLYPHDHLSEARKPRSRSFVYRDYSVSVTGGLLNENLHGVKVLP